MHTTYEAKLYSWEIIQKKVEIKGSKAREIVIRVKLLRKGHSRYKGDILFILRVI